MKPPTTPPSTVKASNKVREVPHFSIPDETPTFQTPHQRNPKGKQAFLTPTSSKPAVDFLITPATIKPSLYDSSIHSQMSPQTPFTEPGSSSKNPVVLTNTPAMSHELTPESTPAKSPRHPKRRRLHIDEFFSSSTDSISSLLLPNHSVVGSGRKAAKNNSHSLRAPISLDFSELSKLNESLAFEEDFDSHHNLDFSIKSPNEASLEHSKSPQNSGPLSIHKDSLDLVSLPNQPGTPQKQLLSDAQVEQWYGKSYRGQFSDDEDSDNDQKTNRLENPFIDVLNSKSAPKSRVFSRGNPFNSKSSINYDTHLELINHRTGERRVELLSESQRKHKPRKLDFSNI